MVFLASSSACRPFCGRRCQCGCTTKLGTWCIPVAHVRATVFYYVCYSLGITFCPIRCVQHLWRSSYNLHCALNISCGFSSRGKQICRSNCGGFPQFSGFVELLIGCGSEDSTYCIVFSDFGVTMHLLSFAPIWAHPSIFCLHCWLVAAVMIKHVA